MNFKKITVAGSGILGSQIAFQSALHGYEVSVYDVNDEAVSKSKNFIRTLFPNYEKDMEIETEILEETLSKMQFFTDLKTAVEDADLVIEAIPENLEIKKEFYRKLGASAPPKTVFATNTSTLLPSSFAEDTGRPGKFLALHFANEIWKHNTAEIMGTSQTEPEIFEKVVLFARSIGMIALPLKKEQPGYILNSLLVPLLNAGITLLVKGIADVETIDKTWMLATGSPMGPFGILDVVGLSTAHHIMEIEAKTTQNPDKQKFADYFRQEFIERGKLGVSSGEGFYRYPNPKFLEKDFLK